MKLPFRREHATGLIDRPRLQLLGKTELDELETEAVRKRCVDDKTLIEADQLELIRKTAFVAIGAIIAAYAIPWLSGTGLSSR